MRLDHLEYHEMSPREQERVDRYVTKGGFVHGGSAWRSAHERAVNFENEARLQAAKLGPGAARRMRLIERLVRLDSQQLFILSNGTVESPTEVRNFLGRTHYAVGKRTRMR